MNIKHAGIVSVDSTKITTDRPVKYVRSGLTVQNMKTGVYTLVSTVYSDTEFELVSATGFSTGTTIQVVGDVFDGEVLSKFLPVDYVTDDLMDFLNVFSIILQEIYTSSIQVPKLKNPDLTPNSLLPVLAKSFGIPIDSDDEEVVKRTFIKVSQYGYRHKATRLGMIAAFRSLGYDLEVKEYFFGKYVNTIESVDGDVITLASGGELPATDGTFRIDDMISESTGTGSRDAVNNPGNFALIRSVVSATEYEIYNAQGTGLQAGDDVVVFSYNENTRVATTSNFDDVSTNEFPLMSSFIKARITDRRPDSGVILTPETLLKLKSFLNEFKSSHARLRGSGVEVQSIVLSDFRDPGDGPEDTTPPEPPIAQLPDVFGTVTFVIPVEGRKIHLDSGYTLDDSLQLDEEDWLGADIVINFTQLALDYSESVTPSEGYAITVT